MEVIKCDRILVKIYRKDKHNLLNNYPLLTSQYLSMLTRIKIEKIN